MGDNRKQNMIIWMPLVYGQSTEIFFASDFVFERTWQTVEEKTSSQDRRSDLSEAEKQEAKEDLEELKEKTRKMTSEANDTVKSLREAAVELDKAWKDCKKTHAWGTVAEIVGGLLTIGGVVKTNFSAGIAGSLLSSLGVGVGAGGAVINFGTSIVEASINSTKIKKTEKDLKETFDCPNDVKNIVQLMLDRKDGARLLFAMQTLKWTEPVFTLIRKVLLRSLNLPSDIVEAACTGKTALEAGQAGVQAAGKAAESGVKAGAKAGAEIVSEWIFVASVAFLLADIADLAFTIRDWWEDKGSNAAKFLRRKCRQT